jgi:hypothetical protein
MVRIAETAVGVPAIFGNCRYSYLVFPCVSVSLSSALGLAPVAPEVHDHDAVAPLATENDEPTTTGEHAGVHSERVP